MNLNFFDVLSVTLSVIKGSILMCFLLCSRRLSSFAPAAEVLAEECPHWTHKDRRSSVCLGPHTLDSSHEGCY